MNAYRTTKTYEGSYAYLLTQETQAYRSRYEMNWLLVSNSLESVIKLDRIYLKEVPITFPERTMTAANVLEPMARELARKHLITAIRGATGDEPISEEPEFVEFSDWPSRLYPFFLRGSERIFDGLCSFRKHLPRGSDEWDFFSECIDLRIHQDSPHSASPIILTEAETKVA